MFKGSLVNLRLQTLKDMDALAELMNSDMYFESLTHDMPRFTYKEQLAKRFKDKMDKHKDNELHLVIETLEGKIIGAVGLEFIFWKNGLAFMYLLTGDPSFTSGGYLEEAIRLFLAFAFHEHNIRKLKTQVLANDEVSLKALMANGFKTEVVHRAEVLKHGRYLDLLELAILRDEYVQ